MWFYPQSRIAQRDRHGIRDKVMWHQRAPNLDATLNDAHRNLGVAYLYRDRPSDAIAQLEEVLKLNPGDTVTQGFLAKAKERAKLQPSGK